MNTEPYTVVNFVVECRLLSADHWATWPVEHDLTEEQAARLYRDLLAGKRRRGGTLQYRVIKRTAVITDEVILEEEPEEPSDHERSAP